MDASSEAGLDEREGREGVEGADPDPGPRDGPAEGEPVYTLADLKSVQSTTICYEYEIPAVQSRALGPSTRLVGRTTSGDNSCNTPCPRVPAKRPGRPWSYS